MLTRLASGLGRLRGWRRAGVALVAGVMATAAMPPWGVIVLLIPSLTCLVWLLDDPASGAGRPMGAALTGWWFGVGHFGTGLYWVGEATLVDAAQHGWLLPFAIGGMAAGLALFPAAVTGWTALMMRAGWVAGAGRIIAFAATWTTIEWVRAWILTGFPWLLMGYVWSPVDAMLQPAALFGIYGLSLLTVAASAMPAVLADPTAIRGRSGAALAVTTLIVALAWTGGAWRLSNAPALGDDTVAGVRLRLVQANIEQRLKWQRDLRQGHFDDHIRLSLQPPAAGGAPPTHVIWPEAAVPFDLVNDDEARTLAAVAVPPGGMLLTGTLRGAAGADAGTGVWNSLAAITDDARIAAVYDKVHLVPFGEFVPLRGVLPFEKLTPGLGDIRRGIEHVTWALPSLPPLSPLICYEVIFPTQVVGRQRPQWMLNVTNDAWFGTSSGPYQHLAIARVRAIEEGLPLVRAASTGVSAVVDAYGRVVARLDLGKRGVLDADLPRALNRAPPFSWGGEGWLAILLLLAVPLASAASQRTNAPAS